MEWKSLQTIRRNSSKNRSTWGFKQWGRSKILTFHNLPIWAYFRILNLNSMIWKWSNCQLLSTPRSDKTWKSSTNPEEIWTSTFWKRKIAKSMTLKSTLISLRNKPKIPASLTTRATTTKPSVLPLTISLSHKWPPLKNHNLQTLLSQLRTQCKKLNLPMLSKIPIQKMRK